MRATRKEDRLVVKEIKGVVCSLTDRTSHFFIKKSCETEKSFLPSLYWTDLSALAPGQALEVKALDYILENLISC